jgi:hypothetical protein
MGNWTGDSETEYRYHRLTGDAKHFPANEETKQPAATFLSIVHGTKNGEDIFIDVRVVRGAAKAAGLKKGQEVSVRGRVDFALDRNGKLRGKMWDAHLSYGSAVRESLKVAEPEAAAPPPAEVPADDGSAPAFE